MSTPNTKNYVPDTSELPNHVWNDIPMDDQDWSIYDKMFREAEKEYQETHKKDEDENE